jgi:serine/threonine-protein kinase ATR
MNTQVQFDITSPSFESWLIQQVTSNEPISDTVSKLMSETNEATLLKVHKRIVTKLVELMDKNALEVYASVAQTTTTKLWLASFADVLAHLILVHGVDSLHHEFVNNICDTIGHQLLGMVHSNAVEAFKILCQSIEITSDSEKSDYRTVFDNFFSYCSEKSKTAIVELQLACLTAVLSSFHSEVDLDTMQVDSPQVCRSTLIVRLLKHLLISIGSPCSYLCPHILSLLRKLVTQYTDFKSAVSLSDICDTWLQFLKLLDDAKLVNVFIPTVELLKSHSVEQKVLDIFDFLFLKRDYVTRDLFMFCDLPDDKPLQPLRQMTFNIERGISDTPDRAQKVVERKLWLAVEGISHRQLEIQRISIRRLKETIQQNYTIISNWIETSAPYDNNHFPSRPTNTTTSTPSVSHDSRILLVSELIVLLFRKCSATPVDDKSDDRQLYAECLGLIGAIDPGRLSLNRVYCQISNEMADTDLAYTILENYLCMYLDHSTVEFSVACICTQSLLIYIANIPESLKLEHTIDYNKLKDLTYLAASEFTTRDLPHRSTVVTTYREWLSSFCMFLCDASSNSLYKCLESGFDILTPLNQFLLPFMMKNVINFGTDDSREYLTRLLLEYLDYDECAEKNFEDTTIQEIHSTLLSTLDTLRSWLYKSTATTLVGIDKVEQFLNSIPLDVLSKVSLLNGTCTRALMYYESYLRSVIENYLVNMKITCHLPVRTVERRKILTDIFSKNKDINPNDELQAIYRCMDIRSAGDYMKALSILRLNQTIDYKITDLELQGNWSQVINYHELTLRRYPKDVDTELEVLRCQFKQDHLQIVLNSVDGALMRVDADSHQKFKTLGLQAAWRLSQWDHVDKYVGGSDASRFEVQLAKTLSLLQKGQSKEFNDQLNVTKKNVIQSLTIASKDSYELSYPFIVQYHMISEIEQSLLLSESSARRGVIRKEWSQRLNLMDHSMAAREPILALRNVLFNIMDQKQLIGECWLSYANLAREQGDLSRAIIAVHMAEPYKSTLPEYILTLASIMHDQSSSSRDEAIKLLGNQNVHGYIKQLNFEYKSDVAQNILISKMKQTAADWTVKEKKRPSRIIIQNYLDVIQHKQNLHSAYYALGKYCDIDLLTAKLSASSNNTERANVYFEDIKNIIVVYICCLRYGVEYVDNVLPRIITLVCDFGDIFKGNESQQLVELNQNILALVKADFQHGGLSLGIWMRSLILLLTRLSHSNSDTRSMMHFKLAELLDAYPKQVMWQFSHLYNSKSAVQKAQVRGIYNHALKRNRLVLNSYQSIIGQFIELCSVDLDKGTHTLSAILPSLQQSIRALPHGAVLIPLLSQMMIDSSDESNSIYIVDIDEQVEVLSSLAKPRKVVILGSDGNKYPFLVKPNDNLNRDNRFSLFAKSVNKILMRSPETRRRCLYIRRYAATALTETSGLIEWVGHTTTYGRCIASMDTTNFYSSSTIRIINNLSAAKSTLADDSNQKIPVNFNELTKTEYLKQEIQAAPSVFHRWFNVNFPEPIQWFNARSNYTKTHAVMCINGYLLGLGDRHAANILMDSSNGDLIHIDYNMLFEQGTMLKIKERVPFRLTHNMVDAMGIGGTEGLFKETCMITLETLRANHDLLMNLVETFIQEPLIQFNPQWRVSETVHRKLKGYEVVQPVREQTDPLKKVPVVENFGDNQHNYVSVRTQIEKLIELATDEERLAHMYPPWGAWK